MQVFETSIAASKEDAPESRSMKMQSQIKTEKMMTLLQTFEEQKGRHQAKIAEKVNLLKT
jgi:predicted XRE-type DNA-binding protein